MTSSSIEDGIEARSASTKRLAADTRAGARDRPSRGVGWAKRGLVGLAALGCVGLAAVAASVTSRAAETVTFNLSTGDDIRLPSLDHVRCGEVLELLFMIDRTGYREFTPEPPTDPNDFLLYQYEWELARMAREDCPMRGLRSPSEDEFEPID